VQGIYTALATPFTRREEIDFPALEKILNQQTRAGIQGFVVCGTTGESSTLSREEKKAVLRFVSDYAKGKNLELVAGTGTNDTRETIELTKEARAIGYEKFLVVVPYYNKPSARGLQAHFEAVANACDGSVILYNVPGRTGISLSAETIAELAAHPKIFAIKEASGNLKFLGEIQNALRVKGRSLQLLSGDDPTYLPFIQAGGHGVISVSSHVCPSAIREMEASFLRGDSATAEKIQSTYLPIFNGLFIEVNPSPVKWALALLGLCENQFRLPLVPVSEKTQSEMERIFAAYQIRDGEFRA
jgi:4-hydroxy-tetrahydrodipicolinate synthase